MEAKDLKFRVMKTLVFGFWGEKTYKELQYLDPVEGWTSVPVEYKFLGVNI